MIINGGSRSNGGFFAQHLMRTDHNARVAVIEMRGLAAETVPAALREMQAVAGGTRCTNYFYHANLNPRGDELLTSAQWQLATDMLERELGLTDQPRFVVEHEKDGRTHRHVVWSRIDADSMTAIADSLTYAKHERAARAIEATCGQQAVPSVLVKDRTTARPPRNPRDWESLRGAESTVNPKAMQAEVTALWHAADSGAAFAAALEASGFILVRGDRRDFCIIDAAGNDHALARRIAGVKAAEIRTRLAGIDREQLPSVAEGRALARARPESSGDAPPESLDSFSAIHAETVAQVHPAASAPHDPLPMVADFAAAHGATVAQAHADMAVAITEEAATPGSRFARVRAWWGNVRDVVAGWRTQLRGMAGPYDGQGHPDDEASP